MINLIKNEFIKLGKVKFIGSHLVFLVSIIAYYYVNKKVLTEDFILKLIPFIGVVLSIIFCSIVSSEYTRGTFRIYLTKPVKRAKVYISKLLTIFLTFYSILLHNLTIYATFTQSISVNFTIKYISYSQSLVLTSVIIIMLSTILKSSSLISSITILLLTFGFTFFELLTLTNINFLEYTFLPYLDLNMLSRVDEINELLNTSLSLKNGIFIIILYSILFFIIGIISFKKKDIKN